MITVRYTKAQYMARITELEGYHGQLQQHLEKLEELREQVFVFWEDANAEKSARFWISRFARCRIPWTAPMTC